MELKIGDIIRKKNNRYSVSLTIISFDHDVVWVCNELGERLYIFPEEIHLFYKVTA